MRRRGLLLLELLAVARALSHSSSASGRGLGVHVCNVREHGARGDNATEDTAALASALTRKQGGIRAMDDAKELVDVPLHELRGLLAKRPSAFAYDHGDIVEHYLAASSSD